MKTIGYFPEARAELGAATAVSRDPTEFRRVVDEALRDIASGVIAHAVVPRTPCRECVPTGVPYSIIYIETDDEIRVVAFTHHKRRRGYWKARLRPKP